MEVQEQFGDDITIVGVPGLAGRPAMMDFVAETGTTTITHVPDGEGEIWRRFGVSEQRTYVFINDDGTWRRGGYGSLREDVEGLIAQ